MEFGTIIALDVATHTGVCIGQPGEKPRLYTHDWRDNDEEEVTELYGRATGWMARHLRDDAPALVVIEKPVPPSAAKGKTNHHTTMLTLPLYGIFCGLVKAKKIELLLAPISTWRKWALGKGNLKGSDAKAQAMALCRGLGLRPPTHDAAESYCIWMWACAQKVPSAIPPEFFRRTS